MKNFFEDVCCTFLYFAVSMLLLYILFKCLGLNILLITNNKELFYILAFLICQLGGQYHKINKLEDALSEKNKKQ